MEKHLCDEGTATMADVVGVCWLHAILSLSLSFHFPFRFMYVHISVWRGYCLKHMK